MKDDKPIIQDNSAEACYNVTKDEYLHAFNRSDKLDNKVYIALTVCAFIFLFVMELLTAIPEFKFPTEMKQFLLISVYIALGIIDAGLFLYTLTNLAELLKPMKVDRINPSFILENDFHKKSNFDFYTFVSVKYAKTINENNIELEKRFKKYNDNISRITIIVILSFILNTIKLFIL